MLGVDSGPFVLGLFGNDRRVLASSGNADIACVLHIMIAGGGSTAAGVCSVCCYLDMVLAAYDWLKMGGNVKTYTWRFVRRVQTLADVLLTA